MSDVANRIKSAGYYGASISPARFVAERIVSLAHLLPILEKCQVGFRGREFPRINRADTIPDRPDSIAQESTKYPQLEAWRFHQSGQFNILSAVPTDWYQEMPGGTPAPAAWIKKGEYLFYEHVLMTFAQIFELAARLCNTPAGDEQMLVEITVGGMKGRRLTPIDQMGNLDRVGTSGPAAMDEFKKEYQFSRSQLMAETGALSVRATQHLYDRFGKSVPAELLLEWYEAYGATR